ncbi:MAG: hypothetical protein RLZZ333_1321, partial [Bacteroidota bacterium]
MDANKILSTDLIDLVFEGRNKSYGAYELRTQYNKRLRNSLVITASIALMLLLGSFLSSLTTGNKKGKVKSIEVTSDQFVPKVGYDVPMISAIGQLTAVQQQSLN